MKIAALGEASRIGAGVAQLDTKIDALAASKTFVRNVRSRIIEYPSLLLLHRLALLLPGHHLFIGITRRFEDNILYLILVIGDHFTVAPIEPDHEQRDYDDRGSGPKKRFRNRGGKAAFDQPPDHAPGPAS